MVPPPYPISVVVPTRNRAAHLRRTLDTVLAQYGTSPSDYEVIVVDDGSTDETPRLLAHRSLASQRLVRAHTDGVGAAAARNIGIGLARGRWVAFADDDCLWTHGRVLALRRAIAGDSDARLFLTGVDFVGEQGRSSPRRPFSPGHGHPRGWDAGTVAMVVRRDALLGAGGFDEALLRLQDFDLLVRLAALQPPRFLAAAEARVCSVDVAGISADPNRLRAAAGTLADKYARADWPAGYRVELLQHLAYKLAMADYGDDARACLDLARRLRPFNPKTRLLAAFMQGDGALYRRLVRGVEAAPR